MSETKLDSSENEGITPHHAGLVFQKMSGESRKKLLACTRKFMKKQPPPRTFTYRLLENRRLQKAISKDIRAVSNEAAEQLEALYELFDEAASSFDCHGLQESVDMVFDLADDFYYKYSIFKIFMYGFFEGRNDAMMAKYKVLRFIQQGEEIFDVGVRLWKILVGLKDELGYDSVYNRFKHKAELFGTMISRHCQGKTKPDQPWYSADVDSCLDFFEVWRPLEFAVFKQNSIPPRQSKAREETKMEASNREEIPTSDSEIDSLKSISPREDIADDEMSVTDTVRLRKAAAARRRTRPRDSFDRFLDGRAI